jgi:hypothetical protein
MVLLCRKNSGQSLKDWEPWSGKGERCAKREVMGLWISQ